jgi:hypothetical protein
MDKLAEILLGHSSFTFKVAGSILSSVSHNVTWTQSSCEKSMS